VSFKLSVKKKKTTEEGVLKHFSRTLENLLPPGAVPNGYQLSVGDEVTIRSNEAG
jgi:hypothetical protein